MHRRLILLALVVVLSPACATRSDRVTTPPSIPTSLVPNGPGEVGTGRCSFAVGGGLGARITDIVVDGPAAATLLVDDVIVGFGGEPIRTSSDLVAAVRARAAGDTVSVEALRNGQPITAPVTLGSSAEGRTLLGVIVTTLEDRIEPKDVASVPLPGPLTRVVAVADGLWLLDPLGITWSSLGIPTPEGALVSVDGDVFTVEVTDEHSVRLIGEVSGRTVDVDLIEWDAVSVIGTLNDSLLIGTERRDAAGAVQDRGVIAVDPATGRPGWVWITDPASATPVPLIGYRSLDGTRILVGLGATDATAPVLWVLVSEQDGQPVAAVAAGLSADTAVLGWYDGDRVIAIVDTIGDVALIDPDTGTSVRTTMPVSGEPAGIWPVGDGANVLVEDGSGLVLAAVGSADRRLLTASCGASRLTDLGWSAG
jgi:hypothetical protein